MGVSATSSGYTDLLKKYSNQTARNTGFADVDKENGRAEASRKSAPGKTSGLLTPQGRKELMKALGGMKKAGYASSTFEDVEAYRQDLEKKFSATIKQDLAKLGVDLEIEFRLVVTALGEVQVLSDHKDKGIVEKYLKDNPKKVEEFTHIQALSNLKRATQKTEMNNPGFTKNLRISLQAEALSAFFAVTEANGAEYFSQIANFNGQDPASFFLGINRKV